MNPVELVQMKVLAIQAANGDLAVAMQIYDWLASTTLDAELDRRAKQREAAALAE